MRVAMVLDVGAPLGIIAQVATGMDSKDRLRGGRRVPEVA